MTTNVYKIIEIVGSSTKSADDAIRRAIKEASQSLRHLRWFEVAETRGHIEDGVIAHWQVVLKVGFAMEEAKPGKR